MKAQLGHGTFEPVWRSFQVLNDDLRTALWEQIAFITDVSEHLAQPTDQPVVVWEAAAGLTIWFDPAKPPHEITQALRRTYNTIHNAHVNTEDVINHKTGGPQG